MAVPPENRDEEIRTRLEQKRYEQAFDLIVERHSTRILRLSFSILGNLALAEDATQDVLVRIWKALPGYRGDASVSTWVFAITRNTCRTALKRVRENGLSSIDEPSVRGVVANTAALPPPERMGDDLRTFVLQLPQQYRQVLTLFYMEEKSYDEVARLLDMPLGTVKTNLHRARKALAAAILQSRQGGGI